MRKTHLVAFIALPGVIALLFFVPRAFSKPKPPHVNFYDLPGYRRALNQTNDPASKAIRQQIADGPAALARERALAKKEGLPIVVTDLYEPVLPPNKNAALIYEKLGALFVANPVAFPIYADAMSGRYSYTPEQIAHIEKVYNSRQDVFSLLHQATDEPHCVFTNDLSKAPGSFTQWTLREDARLLRTESFLLATQGRYRNAVTNESRGFRLAQHTASHPTLGGYLLGVVMNATAFDGMQDILQKTGPNIEIAILVQQETKAHTASPSLSRALRSELAITDSQIDSLHYAKPSEIVRIVEQSNYPEPNSHESVTTKFLPEDQVFVNNLIDAAEADFLHQMRLLIAAANLPPLKRRAVFEQMDQRCQIAQMSHICAMTSDNLVQVLSSSVNGAGILDSSMRNLGGTTDQQDTRNQAREVILLAGAEVLKQKALTGTFPSLLSAGYIDPFDNKPLGYRREGDKGFVVYSIGADGNFDGGKPGDKWNPHQDIFRYPSLPIPVPADMK